MSSDLERRRHRASQWAALLLLGVASALTAWAWLALDGAAWMPWLAALSSCV